MLRDSGIQSRKCWLGCKMDEYVEEIGVGFEIMPLVMTHIFEKIC